MMLFLVLSLVSAALAQEAANRAALVVSLAEGEVVSRCVAFSEPQISGYELLARSGLTLEVGAAGLGAAICRIEGTGCPADNCFCHCQGAACEYWSYWHQVDGGWQYAQLGASAYLVEDGAIEGWSWGPGSVTEALQPPVVSFDQVCAPAGPTPLPAGAGQAVTNTAGTLTGPGSGPAPAGQPGTDLGPAARGQWLLLALFGFIVLGLAMALLFLRRQGTE
jgi:hypothetical protein